MKIYLAGHHLWSYLEEAGILSEIAPKINVLQSFFYRDGITTDLIPYFDSFMLDSGAFSIIRCGKEINWDEYVEKYIEYINKNKIELFFELDIDKLIGYERVKAIRHRIEKETNKPVIPVWHKRLGKEEFLRMCDEYDYVAIGGIVSNEISRNEYKYFHAFIREAHKRGTKIHGLGFTNLTWLPMCRFDSVDSSSWTAGDRFGFLYKFDGRTIKSIDRAPNSRLKHREAAVHNFLEWVKFINHAEDNL